MAKASDFAGKTDDELFYVVEYSPEEAERIGYSNYSYWGSVFRNFLKNKVAVFFLILFLALVVFSFIALVIGKYDYATLIPDTAPAFTKPNSEFWFGTDNLGRDLFTRMLFGSRISLSMGIFVVIVSYVIGSLIGAASGYYGGILDNAIMRFFDILNCLPPMLLIIVIVVGFGTRNCDSYLCLHNGSY